jgi:peptidoglycan/LPS O-acetylase OafA/YrhL
MTLRRILPALLLMLLLTLVASPQRSASSSPSSAAHGVVTVETAEADAAVESAAATQPLPGDRITVLFAQYTAGVRASRAPPAVRA